MNVSLSELYYTEEEISKFLDKAITSLRSDASRRKGPPRTKVGRKILYKKASLEKWLSKMEKDFDILTGNKNGKNQHII